MLGKASVVFALAGALCLAAAAADRVLKEQLNEQYSRKILFLRHSVMSDAQEYDSEGNLQGKSEEGPWTFCGRILVDKIALEENKLRLEGNHVVDKFDEQARRSIPSRHPERLKVTIQLRSPLASMDQAVAVLGRVFFATENEMLNAAPPDWRPYLSRTGLQDVKELKNDGTQFLPSSPLATSTRGEQVFKPGPNIKAPKLTYSREPEISETARRHQFEGVVGLNVIIDSKGRVDKIIIAHPVGMGLDEEAIRAVKTWRFTPAIQNGQPVAVAVYIEVNFRLY